MKLLQIMLPHLMQQVSVPTTDSGHYTEILADMIFAGWLSRTNPENERLVSNGEFTKLILTAPSKFQHSLLWTAQRWTKVDDETWATDIVEFIKDVWPKQKSLRTTEISKRLAELTLEQRSNYPDVVESVLPLLSKVGPHKVFIPALRKTDETVMGDYPKSTLSLLNAILPDEKAFWPYGAEDALRVIVKRAPELASDPQYIELAQVI